MGLVSVLVEISRKPKIEDVFWEMMVFVAPLWIAVVVGVLVGWAWKPNWANSTSSKNPSKCFNLFKFQIPDCISWLSDASSLTHSVYSTSNPNPTTECSSSMVHNEQSTMTQEDLEYLYKLVEVKDGGPAWIPMMDRSTSTMNYRAWRRDCETGPPQYRSSTIFEDAIPEMVRDFFWDDEFRKQWDDMLISATTLEECQTTGTMAVQWVRKFPFFCSDREYIIGRRIWESERTYYCVTKGILRPSVIRRNKPRRVDLYYSSWCIRAVESKRGDGQKTACEVLLFHYEDMGIPWEIAKLGVRQGMWGAVKKIEPGLRAYQKRVASGASLSPCAAIAHVNTKVSSQYLRSLGRNSSESSEIESTSNSSEEKQVAGKNIPKLIVIGGAIALACGLDHGLLTKAVIFGVARRFAKIGRRL